MSHPATPQPQEETHSHEVGQDTVVQTVLAGLQGGWSTEQLDHWIYDDFLGTLADMQGLSVPALARYLDWLIERLRSMGYPPRPKSYYRARWREIATQLAAQRRDHSRAAVADQVAAGLVPERFVLREYVSPGTNDSQYQPNPFTGELPANAPPLSQFRTEGIFDDATSNWLTNFTVSIDEEVEIREGADRRKVFRCTLGLYGEETPFEITADEFADNASLKSAIFKAGGTRPQLHCAKMDLLREAISALNWRTGHQEPARRALTTDYGWDAEGQAFLVPGGRISANGFLQADGPSELHVDLEREELARHLDLRPCGDAAELQSIRRHIVEDLLRLHDRRVTYTLLGAVGVAVLGRFAVDVDPFALWLTGLTGSGKTFLAKLFVNLFGDFPLSSGRFASWSSTPYYIQRQGHYFKDALYLVDDYKPEIAKHEQVVKVLQNYSDRTGRGRLKVDATTNTTKPIRGLLIATGEDVPEHTASALARCIIIPVQQRPKDLARGARCAAASHAYRTITADFVHQLLARRRPPAFRKLVHALTRYYYRGIAGQQNDSRIARNFALLATGFIEMARYFVDVWPDWKIEVRRFVQQELVAARDEMLGAARQQQPSEIFWSVLGSLYQNGRVEFCSHGTGANRTLIGRSVQGRCDLYYVSPQLALAAVNTCLREQGRPPIQVTLPTLLGQLRRDGRLLDQQGHPLPPDSSNTPTNQPRLNGEPKRCFITSRALLEGSGGEGPGPSEGIVVTVAPACTSP
jgi:hypothetical protein